MNLIFPATVDRISTRKDKTFSVVLGTQELSKTVAGELMQYNGEFIHVLLSLPEINKEQIKAVESTELERDKSKLSQSQKIRSYLWNIYMLENRSEPFEEYYQKRTNKILLDLETEMFELKEK